MIEHMPWPGSNYAKHGLNGQRIAIVGYSHHRDECDPDHNKFTESVMKQVVGEKDFRDALFPYIPSYFGAMHATEFWHSVLFFNFVPECIGTTKDRYKTASPELVNRARRRFLKILADQRPDKVIVFTRKGWNQRPRTFEEETGGRCRLLGRGFPASFTWGTYRTGRHSVKAFGLRHPQYANKETMLKAVKRILAI